jgi:hypothetical protein
MWPYPRSAPRVRAWRAVGAAGAAILAAVALTGCRHHRSAMRPVYALPAAPCPSGDCGTAGGVVTPGFSEPGAVTAPPAPFGDEFGGPASAAPASPPGNTSNEPFLEPNTPGLEETQRRSTAPPANNGNDRDSTGQGPALEPPGGRTTMRPGSRPARAPGRRSLLRRNLQARVDDPADLFSPPRADRPWRYIVLHHSAHSEGSLAEIDRDHRERLGTSGCGYHFIVGNGTGSPDGRIEVAGRWSDQKGGQHCRDSRVSDINEYGIGICLIGDLDQGPPTAAQVESTRDLIAYLQERYNIPPGNVVTHDVVAKSASACPGRHFPTQALLGRERGLARQAPPPIADEAIH